MKVSLLTLVLTIIPGMVLHAGDLGGVSKPKTRNLTLKQATLVMLEFEPELNSTEYDTLSTMADYRIARAERGPQVALNASAGLSDRDRTRTGLFTDGEIYLQRQIGISLQQLLYDGGATRNGVNAARNAHLAQQLNEKSMIESRTTDLVETYMEVIRVRRQIALAQRNVDNHQTMRDMLNERALVGGSRSDVGLVQGRLQLAVNTLTNQRLALAKAEARFRLLTNCAPGELSFPSLPYIPASLESIDYSKNYNILSSVEALEAAEHRYLQTKSAHKPRVYFDTSYTRAQNSQGIEGPDNSASAMIVGSWDLFNGGRKKASECRELFQVGKYEELVRSAKVQTRYNLENLWQERLGAANSVASLEEYAEELSQVNSDYEEQFQIGHQDLLNILDIQNEYYSATSRLVDSQFERDQSSFRILGVQGRLTKTIIGDAALAKHCGGKTPVGTDKYLPDTRKPNTQDILMAERFDGNGPIAVIEPSVTEAYQTNPMAEAAKCDPEVTACKLNKELGFKQTNKPKPFQGLKLFQNKPQKVTPYVASKPRR